MQRKYAEGLISYEMTSGYALHNMKQEVGVTSSTRWMNLTGCNIYGDPSIGLFSYSNGEPTNNPPVAMHGGPYNATAGSTITLDGSGSYDPDDSNPLTYTWSIVSRPYGSQSELDGTTRLLQALMLISQAHTV